MREPWQPVNAADLPAVPLFDVGRAGPVALIDLAPERLAALAAEGRRRYTGLALRLGDRATWRWLARNDNPYRHDIAAVAQRTGVPGAFLLNLSYEWACTSGTGADPSGLGNRMLRTLDWPLTGLGHAVVVARQDGDAGEFFNVTWPGFVGVLTAMAPGRFSAAINQPPIRRLSRSCWFDWALSRRGVWRHSGLPPSHLLRRVFEACLTYAEARAMLIETPICIPAFFTLSGLDAGDGCVIERTVHDAAVHDAPVSISNHWLALAVPSHDRGTDSAGRLQLMDACRDEVPDGFTWVLPPILNHKTRLAVVANAQRGTLMVRGVEAHAPATRDFTLAEHLGAGRGRTRAAPRIAGRA